MRTRLLALLGLQALASCVSPYGIAIVTDAIEHVLNPAYRELIAEWRPWQPATDPLWLFVAPLLQTLLLLACGRRLYAVPRVGPALLLVAMLLAVASFRSIRFVAEYMSIGSALLAVALAQPLAALPRTKLLSIAAIALVLAALAVPAGAAELPPERAPGHGIATEDLPAAVGEWLAAHAPTARLLAGPEDAWFLRYLAPQLRVVVDGRIPFYGVAHNQRVRAAFADASRFAQLIAAHDVNAIVLKQSSREHSVVIAWLRTQADWALVAVESDYALFLSTRITLRDGTRPRALALPVGYGDVASLLQASAPQATAIRASLAALPVHPNTRGYRGWIEGLLALQPALRAGAHAGLRAPRTQAERDAMRLARADLARAAAGAESVPVVQAYLALTQIALCELEDAQSSLELARREGESRETLLGAQELALRNGQRDQVAAFLDAAAALAESRNDAWLASLRSELADPPRCAR